MPTLRVCWSLVLLLAVAHPVYAGIRPSFALDYSSWHATHIVLVITTATDGTFEVVESWKGDLRVSERLVIPELVPAPNAIPISRYPKSWWEVVRGGVSELIPREPVGSRMILFLNSGADEQVPTNRTDKAEHHGWKPSNVLDSMNASVVWIDGNQLYSFTQLMNPGPSVLFASRDSEARLRNRVAEINGIQERMTAAIAIKDGEERAERLHTFACSLHDQDVHRS